MPEVAESTSDTNGFYDSALRRCAEWQHGWRCHGFLSEWREGSILFLWSRLFRLPLTVCAPYKDRVESLYFRSFPITFREGFRLCPSKQHLFIKFLSSYWRLRICSDRFLNVILHEGHSCPKLQNPLLMRMDSATPPNGGAQNDSFVGGVQGTFQNIGRAQSCSCETYSSQLPLPTCAPHKDRGKGLCLVLFPPHSARDF